MNEETFRRCVGDGLTANVILHAGVSVLHVVLHRVLLTEALVAPWTLVRLLVFVDQH